MNGVDIGGIVRRARERRGLSRRIVADRTNVSVHVIGSIERGALQELAGGVYTRGYLRAIAGEIGLDGEWLVREHVSAAEPADDIVVRLRARFKVDQPKERPVIQLAVVIACLIGLLFVLTIRPERTAASAGRQQPHAPVMSSQH